MGAGFLVHPVHPLDPPALRPQDPGHPADDDRPLPAGPRQRGAEPGGRQAGWMALGRSGARALGGWGVGPAAAPKGMRMAQRNGFVMSAREMCGVLNKSVF